jgi:hypothetical protein
VCVEGAADQAAARSSPMLPTGEFLVDVLKEMLEDTEEYESRVWVHKAPQERVL